MEYKVLTLWQPWASLLVYGFKGIETRPKPTNWTIEKGSYLIHAAAKWSKEHEEICFKEPFYSHLLEIANEIGFDTDLETGKTKQIIDLPLGKIIGSVEVEECCFIANFKDAVANYSSQKKQQFITVNQPERSFGDFRHGRSAWICKNPKVLKTYIPYKGGQGYYQNFKGDKDQLIFL